MIAFDEFPSEKLRTAAPERVNSWHAVDFAQGRRIVEFSPPLEAQHHDADIFVVRNSGRSSHFVSRECRAWKEAVLKQGQHRHIDVKVEVLERAIAKDKAVLASHPTRARKAYIPKPSATWRARFVMPIA